MCTVQSGSRAEPITASDGRVQCVQKSTVASQFFVTLGKRFWWLVMGQGIRTPRQFRASLARWNTQKLQSWEKPGYLRCSVCRVDFRGGWLHLGELCSRNTVLLVRMVEESNEYCPWVSVPSSFSGQMGYTGVRKSLVCPICQCGHHA